MKLLVVLLPLLGLVAAQFNVPGVSGNNDGFFNDFGKSSSTTLPPWAHPPAHGGGAGQQAGGAGHHNGGAGQQHPAAPLNGNFGRSQSSTKPPAAPIGNPQIPVGVGANADPGKSGGNSGGLAGFGAYDYFNGGTGGLAPQAAAPGGAAGGRNTNQHSGEQTNGFYGGVGGGAGTGMGPGLIAGGGFDANDLQEKNHANEVSNVAASATTVVGVVVAVLIVIGIFALVAVFLVRQRRNSRVVIGSV